MPVQRPVREYIGTAKANVLHLQGLTPDDCELFPLTVCHNHYPAEIAGICQSELEIRRDSPVITENV